MEFRHLKTLCALAAMIVPVLTVVACSPPKQDTPQPTPTVTPEPTPTAIWPAMLQRTPYPFSTPLPPANASPLDGTYVKFDPRPGERAPCRRCPPYPPEGGVWKMSLEKGIFRVYHEGTGWGAVGSFVVSGDQIRFFNDPHCHKDVGIYHWRLEDGTLTLEVVEDDCGYGLREESLVAYPWESCQPPSTEAAITDHWPTPVGCGMPETIVEE